MSRKNRTFKPEERLKILQEVRESSLTEVCRKYNLSTSLVSKWKQRYSDDGLAGLRTKYRTVDPELKALQEENDRLKRIIAKQALEIEVKGELLKKTPIQFNKKRN